MEKILVFIDWFLPGYRAGGPVQSVANLVHFLQENYQFDIVTRNTDYMESTPYHNIKANCWTKYDKNIRIYYISEEKLSFFYLKAFFKNKNYDHIYITGIYSRYFSIFPLLLARYFRHKHILVASRGMLSPGAVGVKSFRKKLYLSMGRRLGLFKNVYFHVSTLMEEENVRKFFPHNKTVISQNLPRINQLPFSPIAKEVLRVLFLGRVSPEKNLLYAIERLKDIKNAKVEFAIYGTVYDKKYWKECKNMVKSLPQNIKFMYKGSLVPGKVMGKIKEYHVLFLPSKGENFGHSIYECLSVGRPVLISDNTPWQNLQAKKVGWDFSLIQKKQFSAAIENLYKMPQNEYDELCLHAYEFAQNFWKVSKVKENALQLFKLS